MHSDHDQSIPIPYPGAHGGPRRVLVLHLRRGGILATPAAMVHIDGSMYPVRWGTAHFEIPADRPVYLSVYQPRRTIVGLAATVLPPQAPAELEYTSPAHLAMAGEIGPPGTTSARGVGLQIVLLVLLAVVLVALIGLVVALLS